MNLKKKTNKKSRVGIEYSQWSGKFIVSINQITEPEREKVYSAIHHNSRSGSNVKQYNISYNNPNFNLILIFFSFYHLVFLPLRTEEFKGSIWGVEKSK